jgi:hypothetical protein
MRRKPQERDLRLQERADWVDARSAMMKTPKVQEIRRAGQNAAEAHRRQVALVARSLLAVPERRGGWDERTRTDAAGNRAA